MRAPETKLLYAVGILFGMMAASSASAQIDSDTTTASSPAVSSIAKPRVTSAKTVGHVTHARSSSTRTHA